MSIPIAISALSYFKAFATPQELHIPLGEWGDGRDMPGLRNSDLLWKRDLIKSPSHVTLFSLEGHNASRTGFSQAGIIM